ncbi:MAG TPA: ABC transporter permease [Candidatus Saccharimonadales bacterium]|nr:ABC transporter permease [Candidatus Saccharimonadales bacterium]
MPAHRLLRAGQGPFNSKAGTSRLSDVTAAVLRLRAFAVLFLLIISFSLLSPDFLAPENVVLMIKHASLWSILAVGATFVILTAGIDLSVGATVAFTGMIAGGLLYEGLIISPLGITIYFSVPVVVAITLALGVGIGLINGILVTKAHVPPFIATLGVGYVVRGAAALRTNGATFPSLAGSPDLGNTGFDIFGGGHILTLPTQIWIMGAVAITGILIARQTAFGRHIYAVGGNSHAALLAGIRVSRVTVAAYMICGFTAAVAGIIVASELGATNPSAGTNFELTAIAAVVLGGTSLFGGRGTVVGSIVGAFVIGMLADGLVLLGVTAFWQTVVLGLVIIAAVVIDQAQEAFEKSREVEAVPLAPPARSAAA